MWHAGNDGSGSSLDADKLDGQEGSYYRNASNLNAGTIPAARIPATITGTKTFSNGINVGDLGSGGITGSNYNISGVNQITINDPGEGIVFGGGSNTVSLFAIDDSNDNVMNFSGAAELRVNNSKVWTVSNDGSGSGLDADKVDGLQASSFLRSDAADTMSGDLTVDSGTNTTLSVKCDNGGRAMVRAGGDGQGTGVFEVTQDNGSHGGGISYNGDGSPGLVSGESADHVTFYRLASGTRTEVFHYPYNSNVVNFNATATMAGGTVWHSANDGSGSGLDADKLDGQQGSHYLNYNNLTNKPSIPSISNLASTSGATFTGELQVNARLDVGNGTSNDHEIRIYKKDNNVSDHIQFYNGTTRMGEIGCEDTTWLRINQETNKNIYTPRYIRSDGGFFVDGTSKGINGSGNFIGGTIAGASDYGTLLRSNADDSASGTITFNGRVNIRGHLDFADSEVAYFGSSDDWSVYRNANNWTYINDKGNGIIFQDNGTNKMRLEDSGVFRPESTNTCTIGSSSYYWDNGYFQDFNVSGTINVRGAVDLADNDVLRLGSGDDVEFFCNGSHMYMDLNSGIGNFYIRDGSTTRYTFNDNGSFTATGNITAYSDINLKKNIELIPNALDKVLSLRGLTYDRIDLKGEENQRQSGVVAQEVEKVLPEVVSTDEDGIKSVAYGNMVGLLIEAIKEQQEQINILNQKIEFMERGGN